MNELLEQLHKAFEDFKIANDARLKEIEAKGHADPLTEEKVNRINASIGDIQAAINKRVDEIEARLNRTNLGGQTPEDQARAAHRAGFESYFRRGAEAGLRDLEVQASLVSGSDPDGGFVIPCEMDSAISRVMTLYSAMRGLATVRTIGAPSFKKLINLGGASAGWVGDTDDRNETGTPKLAELDFEAMELYANPAATQTMLDDSSMNIESWLSDEVGIAFAEQEGPAFITGNGVKKPRGLLSYTAIANANYAHGKLGYITSGKAGGFADTDPSNALIDLIHALKRGYRPNAKFLMNSLTLAAIRKFKTTTGEYLWQPSLQVGAPSTLLGYAVEEDDYMPDVAANSLSVAFGDFKQGYLIVDRMGTRVLRDPYTKKPYIFFYTTKRVGGGVQKFEAIKLMKFATS